jgi:FKBP-type peptidyl-prolyl cis-trans isomerase
MKRQILLTFITLLTFNCLAQKHIDYYENGNKKYQETKKDGLFIAKRIWWYESGQKKSQAYYDKNGILIGIKQWDESGNLTSNDNFKKQQKKAGKTDLSKIEWKYTDKIGIYYENEGTGNLPSEGDTVVLHYIGYFDNGSQFDNSYERNEPLEFEISNNYMLTAFANSIATFKQGQKGYIRIPPELAYGDKPAGNIPPNSTLTYFVEIIEIK